MAHLDATMYRGTDIDGIDPPALLMYHPEHADNPNAWILSTAFVDFADVEGPGPA